MQLLSVTWRNVPQRYNEMPKRQGLTVLQLDTRWIKLALIETQCSAKTILTYRQWYSLGMTLHFAGTRLHRLFHPWHLPKASLAEVEKSETRQLEGQHTESQETAPWLSRICSLGLSHEWNRFKLHNRFFWSCCCGSAIPNYDQSFEEQKKSGGLENWNSHCPQKVDKVTTDQSSFRGFNNITNGPSGA